MEQMYSYLSFQELRAVEEKDSSSKSQEQKAKEEKDFSLSSQELKTVEDSEIFVFTSPGRKRVMPELIPESPSSEVANGDSIATIPNDSTTTISKLSAPVPSSNVQSVPLSSEDGGNFSFMAATTCRSSSGPSSTMVGSALSTTPSVPHLDISGTALSFTGTVLSISSTTSSDPLVQDDFECKHFTYESQKHQHPNMEESSDPIILLNEPNRQTTQKDKNLSATTGAQLLNSAMSTEENHKDLPLMRISRVLKGIPHCPHFIHLRNFSGLARVKLVPAWDEVFESAVDEIHNLEVKDFWGRAGDLWDTMDELHELGYNVLLPRIRLVEMLDVMEELKQLEVEIQSCENKAEEYRRESLNLESSILDLKATVDEEEDDMVSVLKEIRQMEKKLPKYEDLVSEIAMKPF